MLPLRPPQPPRRHGARRRGGLDRGDRTQRVPLAAPPPPARDGRAARRRPRVRHRPRRHRDPARRDRSPLSGDRRPAARAAPGGDPARLLRALLPRGVAGARRLGASGGIAALQEPEAPAGAPASSSGGGRRRGRACRHPRCAGPADPGVLERRDSRLRRDVSRRRSRCEAPGCTGGGEGCGGGRGHDRRSGRDRGRPDRQRRRPLAPRLARLPS